MAKLVLFSRPTEIVMNEIRKEIFPEENSNKTIAFMPAEGMSNYKEKYKFYWETEAQNHGYKLEYIDLESEDTSRNVEILNSANVLFVTGGNTFVLINLLRKTGLDKYVKEFASKKDNVYVGFSAGAIILSPTIQVAGYEWHWGRDDNFLQLTDLSGLNVVNFDIVAHFDKSIDAENLERYKASVNVEVKAITDDEFLILNT